MDSVPDNNRWRKFWLCFGEPTSFAGHIRSSLLQQRQFHGCDQVAGTGFERNRVCRDSDRDDAYVGKQSIFLVVSRSGGHRFGYDRTGQTWGGHGDAVVVGPDKRPCCWNGNESGTSSGRCI